MFVVRYLIPLAAVIAGIMVIAIQGTGDNALWGGVSLMSAGASILFLNFLFRLGASGDRERDREAAARDYFAKHGHWPDEAPPKTGER